MCNLYSCKYLLSSENNSTYTHYCQKKDGNKTEYTLSQGGIQLKCTKVQLEKMSWSKGPENHNVLLFSVIAYNFIAFIIYK